MAEKDGQEAFYTANDADEERRGEIDEMEGKNDRLTELIVEQDIERGEYLSRKRELMSQKRSAQENILRLERNAAVWLEPMRAWLKEASVLEETAKSKDYPSKKSSLQKIFGSTPPLPPAGGARRAPKSVVFFVGGQRKPLRK